MATRDKIIVELRFSFERVQTGTLLEEGQCTFVGLMYVRARGKIMEGVGSLNIWSATGKYRPLTCRC